MTFSSSETGKGWIVPIPGGWVDSLSSMGLDDCFARPWLQCPASACSRSSLAPYRARELGVVA
jgi:hypothetical protein